MIQAVADGQIGLEESPSEYVAKLVAVFAEVRRVLREDGTCWVNIAPSYAGGGGGNCGSGKSVRSQGGQQLTNVKNKPGWLDAVGYKSGELINIPALFAEAMRADGWLLRAELTWLKTSPMPEAIFGWRWERHRVKVKASARSRTPYTSNVPHSPQGLSKGGGIDGSAEWEDCPGCDRCRPNGGLVLRKGSWRPTRATESIFLFAKSDHYYADGESVKQAARSATVLRDRYTRVLDDPEEQFAVRHDHETECGGKANLRNWIVLEDEPALLQLRPGLSAEEEAAALKALDRWFVRPEADVNAVVFRSENLREQHYAAFPSSLPTLCLKAGAPRAGVCGKCGVPWTRVMETEKRSNAPSLRGKYNGEGVHRAISGGVWNDGRGSTTIGWRTCCTCGVPARPALVLDPFVGSGTTGIAARRLGLRFVGIDLSQKYCELSRKRIARGR